MINVLVVDDDYRVAQIHRKFVERLEQFRVVGEARSGASALQAVAHQKPDLVLLDIYLPDMSGLEVLARLRAPDGPDVDVLAITAARDAKTVAAALRGGVVQYLIKPFGFEDLRARLETYTETRRALARTAAVDQTHVDALFGATTSLGGPQMPKGLSLETAELVRRTLRAASVELSATECGEGTGLSRVSARRYLEYFVAAGVVQVRLQYGTGRPERRYRWSR